MERFAINILHKQIYKICRLCGVDQPSKVPILEETEIEIIVGDEEEATLAKKILDCVGIEVTKDDKMPQNICSLCVDKISDFYEYRLMCAATNLQTRTILNLPLVESTRKLQGVSPKPDVKDIKEDVKIEAASSSSSKKGKKRRGPPSPSPSPSPAPTTRVKAPIDVKDEPVPSTPVKALTKKERLKQLQQQQLLAQQRLEKDKEPEAELKQTRSKRREPSPDISESSTTKQQPEQTVPVPKKIKFEHPCSFCSDEFKTQTELDSHLGSKHVPIVRKFGCGSCRETFESVLEFKDHNLWHQLTRTPYTCFKCKRKWDKNAALVKHVSLNACGRISRGRPPAILPDVQCRLCNRKFKTQNLFEWHGCFLKPKSKCPKCDKYFVKKQILTRHYMMFCTGTLPPPEPLLIPKEEPTEQAATVSSKAGVAAVPGTAAGNVERRTRRSVPAEPDLPKEEREIPFPPPLELEPEAPAPTPSSSAKKRGRPKNVVPVEAAPAAPADAAEKFATLLDTGSKLDKDTDIATINNLLSSVTEAIASISEAKAKKKKKKKDKSKDRVRSVDTPVVENSSSPVDTRTEEERQADEFAVQAAQMSMNEQLALCKMPMVVLAKTSFKQETTEIDTEPAQLQEPLGNGDDDDNDNYEESGNDYGGFQDEDDEEAVPPPAPAPEPVAEEIPFPMPIKQEEETPAGSESQPSQETTDKAPPPPPPQETLFNEQLALNIKREPGLEEDSEQPPAKRKRPESRTSMASPASSLSSSSGPAAHGSPKPTLILKIKKEKGLLNATVTEPMCVDDDEEDGAQSRLAEKARKIVYKKPNILTARIKQEKVDPAYERQEMIAAQNSELPGGIRIKQERIDPEELESSSSPIEAQDLDEPPARKKHCQAREPSPVIAFDGVRIKQEKPDRVVEPVNKPASPSPSHVDNTSKPLEKKKKSKVKINPFALLKQRMAAEAAAKSSSEPAQKQQSASPLPVITNVVGNAPASTTSSSTRSSISGDVEPEQPVPVIAQVQSIANENRAAVVEDDFPMPIKEEAPEESAPADDQTANEEQDEFPMPIKEEAPEETPPVESPDDAEESAEFPMPIKEEATDETPQVESPHEAEESQNGVADPPSAVEEPDLEDVPEKTAEPSHKDEEDEESKSSPSPVEEPEVEESSSEEKPEEQKSPEPEEPEAEESSPEENQEEQKSPEPEEPEVEESSPEEKPEEQKSSEPEEPEAEESSPEENQEEQKPPEEQSEASSPAEEDAEPEEANGESEDKPEATPAKPDESLEHIPEESTSPISDTPMDEYEQNSQEHEPAAGPEKADESAKAPESDLEELQNLLTEGLRPPDLDCSTSVAVAVHQPAETGNVDGLDVDLDSLLNNKLDEISGSAPQQHDDLQLAIERELLNEIMPTGQAEDNPSSSGNGQQQQSL